MTGHMNLLILIGNEVAELSVKRLEGQDILMTAHMKVLMFIGIDLGNFNVNKLGCPNISKYKHDTVGALCCTVKSIQVAIELGKITVKTLYYHMIFVTTDKTYTSLNTTHLADFSLDRLDCQNIFFTRHMKVSMLLPRLRLLHCQETSGSTSVSHNKNETCLSRDFTL